MSLQSKVGPEGPPGEMGRTGIPVRTLLIFNLIFNIVVVVLELCVNKYNIVKLCFQGPPGEPGESGSPGRPGDMVSTLLLPHSNETKNVYSFICYWDSGSGFNV